MSHHSSSPSLANMPEEILNQIISSLLPLKWYSLSVLVSLSRTNSYLRQWLMEDDSLWHLALLGRGMGRPLHTIPGYTPPEMPQEEPAPVPTSKEVTKAKEYATGNLELGTNNLATFVQGTGDGKGNGLTPVMVDNGTTLTMRATSTIRSNGEIDILASSQPNPSDPPGTIPPPWAITLTPPPSTTSGSKKKKGGYTIPTTPEAAQAAVAHACGIPQSAFTFGKTDTYPDWSKPGTKLVCTPFTVTFDRAQPPSSSLIGGPFEGLLGVTRGAAVQNSVTGLADILQHGLSVAASKGKGKEPTPTALPASPSEVKSILSSARLPVPIPTPGPRPPPRTYRDLALRVYTHEAGCVNCKVADSKLSHFFMSDGEMGRTAEGMGVMKGVVDAMRKLPGGKGWGEGKVVKGCFERVVGPKEASKIAVRTSKFFAGYDSFGHCPHTLALRVSQKSELLTTPPLAVLEISVFIPAKRPMTVTQTPGGGVSAQPEVLLISSFKVVNWGGVALGDFQWAFQRWAQGQMTAQEITDFESKGYYGASRAGKTTREALIPLSSYGRFRSDDKLYEVGDIRPLGQRIEHGRGAILLGYKYPGN